MSKYSNKTYYEGVSFQNAILYQIYFVVSRLTVTDNVFQTIHSLYSIIFSNETLSNSKMSFGFCILCLSSASLPISCLLYDKSIKQVLLVYDTRLYHIYQRLSN